MAAKLILCTMISVALITTPCQAKGALDKFFKSLGGQTNSTSPGAFHDQAAGYYTGGGYVLRQNNSVVNPINISLPRIGVGCNSLDLYFGGISFIKSEQLVQMARQIATGAPTYAFQLSMKTFAPQIENLMSQLRKQVQDINGMMLNSCQASQQIVGGLWPKGTAASEQICMDQTRSGNNDWFGARSHCEDTSKVSQKVTEAQKKHKDLLQGEYNLVWHVLQKMPEYANNKQLAYFIMSVTGTLISKKESDPSQKDEDPRYRIRLIEPRADQKEFIAAYLKGGTTSQLVCDEGKKCLAVKTSQITIENDVEAAQPSMRAKVIQMIGDLRVKYISKTAVTQEDITFLNDSVNLPVYRYIQVSVAAGTHFMMQDAAEFIAAAVLLTQFDRVMSEVIEAVDALQKIQLEDTAIGDFKKNLQQARGRVQALLIGANNGSVHTLNQAIQAIEQAIIAKNS